MSSKAVNTQKSGASTSTLFSRCTPRLRKARSNQRANNNCYGLSFSVKALTWVSDSHGLFDYESRNLHVKNFNCRGLYGSYEVVRIGVDVKLLNSDDAQALKLSDSRCKTLVKLYCKDGGYNLVGDTDEQVEPNLAREASIFSNNSAAHRQDEHNGIYGPLRHNGNALVGSRSAVPSRDISAVSVAENNTIGNAVLQLSSSLLAGSRHQLTPMMSTNPTYVNNTTTANGHTTNGNANRNSSENANAYPLLLPSPRNSQQLRLHNSVAASTPQALPQHDLWLVVRQRGVCLKLGDVLRVGRHQLSVKELVYDTPSVSSHISLTYLGNEDCDTVAPSQYREQSAVLSDNDIPSGGGSRNTANRHRVIRSSAENDPTALGRDANRNNRLMPAAAANVGTRSTSLSLASRNNSMRHGRSDNSANDGHDDSHRRLLMSPPVSTPRRGSASPRAAGQSSTSLLQYSSDEAPLENTSTHGPSHAHRSRDNSSQLEYVDRSAGHYTDTLDENSHNNDIDTGLTAPVYNHNTVEHNAVPADNISDTNKTIDIGSAPRVTVHRSSSDLDPPHRRRRRVSDASSSHNTSSSSRDNDISADQFMFPNSDVEAGMHTQMDDSVMATGRQSSLQQEDDFRSADEEDIGRNVSRMSTGSSHYVGTSKNEDVSKAFVTKDGLKYSLSTIPSCRICLCEEEMPHVNPLVAPCECKGSMKYVHLQCLRTWMQGRLGVDSEGTSVSFFWRVLDCELCQINYPTMIDASPLTTSLGNGVTSKYVELFQLPRPKPPYIILEPQESDGSGLHFVSFSSVKIARLGRGHNADVRIGDISVSRHHAWLKYVPQRNPGSSGQNVGTNTGFYLEDLQSKFGTLVQLRTPHRVTPGRNIPLQIGRTVLVFCIKRNWRLLGHSWFQSGRIRPDIVCQLISSDVTASEAVIQDGVLQNFNDADGDCVRNVTQ